MNSVITLTTDFGTRDNYVGVMKGVILALAPKARLVDLTHEIEPHATAEAAFCLLTAFSHFPPGAVHLAVVDPGVGASRAVCAAHAHGQFFIGPDNGLFTPILDRDPAARIRRVRHDPPASRTFHGRDVMAPAAARLALGEPFEALGPVLENPVRLAWPTPEQKGRTTRGQVIHADRFGNLVTNIEPGHAPWDFFELALAGRSLTGPAPAYAAAPKGMPLALWASHGFLEIAVNQGSAQAFFKAGPGQEVLVCAP